jgi:hypothetical protein
MPTITSLGYEPKKTPFFEQKTSPPTKLENNMASDFETMKKTMSLLPNELIGIKLNSLRNKDSHPRQLVVQNNYSQNHSRNFGPYGNINNENNGIIGMSPSKNGCGYNDVLYQPPQIME